MEDYWLPKPVHGPPDDSENALIILGGGSDSDENVTELGVSDDTTLNPRLSESLRTILPKAFPQFFDKDTEPEMEWTGIMAFTDIADPIVGPVPVSVDVEGKYLPGQFIAAGYTGHGMSRAYSCAEAVVQMVFEEMQTKEGEPCFIRPNWLPVSFTTLRPPLRENEVSQPK
jgi:glycine/D-amino acid oxidase-like deaminating enzyme